MVGALDKYEVLSNDGLSNGDANEGLFTCLPTFGKAVFTGDGVDGSLVTATISAHIWAEPEGVRSV